MWLSTTMSVGGSRDVPAVADKTRHDVFTEGPFRGTVERDAVVVVDPAQIRQLQVAGERSGFARDAFHEVAVAAHGVHIEVEDFKSGAVVVCGQPLPGNGHAHAVAAALPQGSGGGLDAGGNVRFGMAGSFAVDLAEALDLFHRKGRLVEDFAVRGNVANSGEM